MRIVEWQLKGRRGVYEDISVSGLKAEGGHMKIFEWHFKGRRGAHEKIWVAA